MTSADTFVHIGDSEGVSARQQKINEIDGWRKIMAQHMPSQFRKYWDAPSKGSGNGGRLSRSLS